MKNKKPKQFSDDTSESIIHGIIRMHPRGFGFVQPEGSRRYNEDIFIPKHLTLNAVDGDKVEVIVIECPYSEKGPEGKVVTILSRSKTHIAGIICDISRKGKILAHAPLLGTSQEIIVDPADNHLRIGDRVVMEVLDWGSETRNILSRATHVIGHIDDPSCDIEAAVEEFELRKEFPHEVILEAESFGKIIPSHEVKNREDFRDIECFTIDPDTAKDFDDALSLSLDKNGHFHLGVHIADVSHYVRPGTALDVEAKMRCNSTYFPGHCIPMLPSELSNNLCSLKPNVNRLTASVLMEFDQTGSLVDYRMTRGVIKSKKRFTYKEAKEVLDKQKESPHLSTLNLMVKLCYLLKKKRYERGSLEFSIPEIMVIVDKKGDPIRTEYVEYDITHQLVEEFMLKANEVIATHISKKGQNLTYRVHDIPSEESMKDFAFLASAFGFKISDHPTPKELQELFDEALQTTYGRYLSTAYIKKMRLALYSPENIGHYGLGLNYYCHFTSPIRRYVDLVSHRILFETQDPNQNLYEIADQCSEQERISAKAESQVTILKKLRLLQKQAIKNPHQHYPAIITKVRNFGIYFEIDDFMIEGYLHVSELENDYYIFSEKQNCLIGSHTNSKFSAGSKIDVLLKEVDLISLETKWTIVQKIKHKKKDKKRFRRMEKKKKRKILYDSEKVNLL